VVGVGAAGTAVTRLLLEAGVTNIIGCDRDGAIYAGKKGVTGIRKWYAKHTNPEGFRGGVEEALEGADVLIGLSGPGAVPASAVHAMARDAIVFAMANPTPEVAPEEIEGVARVIATGRSDYPNQINNVLCFPGMFRGALDSQATTINDEMNLAAARAIASVISEDELHEEYVIPSVFNKAVVERVAAAVAEAAIRTGVAQRDTASIRSQTDASAVYM
jgi:malate dehydrogenase (oxaloacetate-decarboxylating)